MKLSKWICLFSIALMACTQQPKTEDFSHSIFTTHLKLNGIIPYQQSLKDVVEKLGKPDSVVKDRYYFNGVSYYKYNTDSVHLNGVDFIKCPETFVASGNLKLSVNTQITDIKDYHLTDLTSEMDSADIAKYQLMGISGTVTPAYNFWALSFNRQTGRLIKMELMLFD
jgi:hypothetical protein